MEARVDVTIRRAARHDEAAIVELVARNGLPLDGLLDLLDAALVASAGGRVVGCAALEVYADSALLRSVAVDETARGQGIGQRLVRAALDLAHERGVRSAYLLTTTAEPFFPRFGFQRIDRREVPVDVQQSVEFRSACPASAAVMAVQLATGS
jgi:amino-acid N-acetyltransferase